MIQLPKSWFSLELFKLLRARVRGPICKVRRRMCTIKMRCPKEVFDELTSRLTDGDVPGLEREEESGELKPTRTTGSSRRWEYSFNKPMASDRLFSLERADLKGVAMKEGKGAWKRSSGCASIKLSDSAKKGAAASAMSMVGGNVVLTYIQPKAWRAWPTIKLKFFVLTVDYQGNIIWPTVWDANARALLTELARRKVVALKAHPDFPIRDDFCETPGASSAVATAQTPALPAPAPPPLLLH